ncbi:hypothetical protein GCM10025768_05870 [Microbacterium pseudoresistens]|uniref:Uncharacterized protein n=1 Tax=Microbacterium pseudoresistens TaxID=640634 RepID=A0A7Y9EV71_9MICO|nr:hypothetical protein [Microbacterium pseudoresistens]NYD54424.1 hypothetical protein [Microbacterium pseudoresistens]
MTTDAREKVIGPEDAGLRGFVWYAWPWVNWLLPVYVVFHGFLGNGGWESVMLMMGSPVIIPAAGLLGSLPRFIMRKSGHRYAPWPLLPALFVLWWSWLTAAMAMPAVGDSGSDPSILSGFVSGGLSEGFENGVMAASILLGALAWVLVLGLASSLPIGAGERPPAPLLGRLSFFVVPLILVAVVVIGGLVGDHA